MAFINENKGLKLYFNDKVEIISTWDEKIHWASGSMKIPAIIRLKYYVKYVQRRSPFSRLAIFRRDRYCCQYCGVVLGEELLTVDHVLPKSRGGLKSWTNMVTSCKSCNTFKNNRTPEEAGIKLIQIPFMPEMKLKHSLPVIGEIHPDWHLYLK